MNKQVTLLLASILLIGFVAAAWVFQYEKEVNAEVYKGGNKLEVVLDFHDFSINTSEGADQYTQNLTLNNKKYSPPVQVLMNVTKVLTELGCPDYENDCSVELWNETHQLFNGSTYTLDKGLRNFTLTASCVENSCGQNITTYVKIEGI